MGRPMEREIPLDELEYFPPEKLRSVGELIFARTALKIKQEALNKDGLSLNLTEKSLTYYSPEDTKKILAILSYEKFNGRELALNYTLGRKTNVASDVEQYTEEAKVLFPDKEIDNPPAIRPASNIIEARDLMEQNAREAQAERHRYNCEQYIRYQASDTIKTIIILTMLEGKLEGINYALSEDNEISAMVKDAKQQNILPIKLFPNP